MRTKPRALPVAVAVILTLVAAVALPQAAATTSKPTLRLSSLCEDYPLVSGIEVRARGFAPYTVITETVQRAYDDGSSDSFSSQTTLRRLHRALPDERDPHLHGQPRLGR